MDLFKNYAESLFKDLPRDKQTKQAKIQLIEMMTHHYEHLISQGKMPNEAASEAILEYGDLFALAPELSIADLLNQQATPVKDEEAQSFVEASQKFSKTTLWSIGILTWAVLLVLTIGAFPLKFTFDSHRYAAGWVAFFLLFFVPCLVAFFQHFLAASEYLRIAKKIGFRAVDLKAKSDWTETIQKRDKKLKCLRIIGLILLIIGVLGSMVFQAIVIREGEYCGMTRCDHIDKDYFLDIYKWGELFKIINFIFVMMMGAGSMMCVKVFIDGFANRFVLGKTMNIRLVRVFKWAWMYWLVIALSFMLFPGPFRRFAFIIDFWPWAMALFMLVILVWHLITRKKTKA